VSYFTLYESGGDSSLLAALPPTALPPAAALPSPPPRPPRALRRPPTRQRMKLGRRIIARIPPFRTFTLGFGLLAASAATSGTVHAGAAADAGEADAGAASVRPGPPIEPSTPPRGSEGWARACSFRDPLCVRATPGTPGPVTAAALIAAERAWEAITGALAAPPPDGGLDGRWQVYLVDGAVAQSPARLVARGLRRSFDRASSFGLVDRLAPLGCPLDLAVARAVARASLWRAAPATDPGSSAGSAEALARLATPCSAHERDDDVEFQWAPERTVIDAGSAAFDRGAAMFFGWLDARFGTRPGGLLLALRAVAPTTTPAGAWRWAGAPTEVDVLRVSLASALWEGSTIDDVFAAFAAARASMNPSPRLTWSIPWPLDGRRLASAVPVAPTGSSYVAIDHAGAPRGSKLRVEATWEDYGRMRWIVRKLDAAGKVLDELPIPSTDRATEAAMTVENLDDTERIVVVGVNLGSTEMPFAPDDAPWEPHGWLLTLSAR
jgi:hypothetical protein